MARGFNDEEKRYITNALIEAGRELFGQWGFQKTSIVNITKQVGIAQGTFYSFFSSKEALYFVILEQEEEKIREAFAHKNISAKRQPKKALKKFLKEMLQAVETNPFLRELYVGSNLEKLQKGVPQETFDSHFQRDATDLVTLVEEQGMTLNEKPEIAAGILRSLFLMTLHQNEIGQDVYPKTMERLVDMTVDALVKEGK